MIRLALLGGFVDASLGSLFYFEGFAAFKQDTELPDIVASPSLAFSEYSLFDKSNTEQLLSPDVSTGTRENRARISIRNAVRREYSEILFESNNLLRDISRLVEVRDPCDALLSRSMKWMERAVNFLPLVYHKKEKADLSLRMNDMQAATDRLKCLREVKPAKESAGEEVLLTGAEESMVQTVQADIDEIETSPANTGDAESGQPASALVKEHSEVAIKSEGLSDKLVPNAAKCSPKRKGLKKLSMRLLLEISTVHSILDYFLSTMERLLASSCDRPFYPMLMAAEQWIEGYWSGCWGDWPDSKFQHLLSVRDRINLKYRLRLRAGSHECCATATVDIASFSEFLPFYLQTIAGTSESPKLAEPFTKLMNFPKARFIQPTIPDLLKREFALAEISSAMLGLRTLLKMPSANKEVADYLHNVSINLTVFLYDCLPLFLLWRSKNGFNCESHNSLMESDRTVNIEAVLSAENQVLEAAAVVTKLSRISEVQLRQVAILLESVKVVMYHLLSRNMNESDVYASRDLLDKRDRLSDLVINGKID